MHDVLVDVRLIETYTPRLLEAARSEHGMSQPTSQRPCRERKYDNLQNQTLVTHRFLASGIVRNLQRNSIWSVFPGKTLLIYQSSWNWGKENKHNYIRSRKIALLSACRAVIPSGGLLVALEVHE